MMTLRIVLDQAELCSWKDKDYVPKGIVLGLETECLVLPSEEDDPALPSPEAERCGFRYVLSVGEIQDIVSNARLQRRNVSPDELLRAFVFYLENDAFISFQ